MMPSQRWRPRPRFLAWWARGLLVFLALLWAGVFVLALVLDPYQGGRVWTEETHRQLGLPPCTFKALTGMPCASCGMSTSFALAIRGDLVNSLRANFVGTGLALFGVVFIAWALVSAWRARLLWIRSLERVIIFLVLGFVAILFLRWGVVLMMYWLA
jgi:hypothetical protein